MRYVTTIEPVLIEAEWQLRVLTKSHGNLLVDERELLVDDPMIMYKQEAKMPYVTTIERLVIEKGLQQGVLKKAREYILKMLQERFKDVSLPETLVDMIKAINESAILDALFEQSMTVESVPAFEQKVAELAKKNGSG